jgi:hypothetical protein
MTFPPEVASSSDHQISLQESSKSIYSDEDAGFRRTKKEDQLKLGLLQRSILKKFPQDACSLEILPYPELPVRIYPFYKMESAPYVTTQSTSDQNF